MTKKSKDENGTSTTSLELPKYKTLEQTKSFIVTEVRNQLKLDFFDHLKFPVFNEVWSGVKQELKRGGKLRWLYRHFDFHVLNSGKMNIEHHKNLPPEMMEGAMDLFAVCETALATRGTPEYDKWLRKIPVTYRDRYHIILQWGAQWSVTLLEANRGREVTNK